MAQRSSILLVKAMGSGAILDYNASVGVPSSGAPLALPKGNGIIGTSEFKRMVSF